MVSVHDHLRGSSGARARLPRAADDSISDGQTLSTEATWVGGQSSGKMLLPPPASCKVSLVRAHRRTRSAYARMGEMSNARSVYRSEQCEIHRVFSPPCPPAISGAYGATGAPSPLRKKLTKIRFLVRAV